MFYEKYIKYREKYILLKSQMGGVKENDYVKSTDKTLVGIYSRNGWPNIFKINKIFPNGNISVLNLSKNININLPHNTVEVLTQEERENLMRELEESRTKLSKNEDIKTEGGEEVTDKKIKRYHKEGIKLENYYLVHNYLKIDKIFPYKKLIPRGDSGFKAVEKFAKKNNDLKNLEGYILYANKTFILSKELPPAQSNIGIFFWLIPKNKIPLNKIFRSEDIETPLNVFSYIFDAKQLFKYIIYKSPHFGTIPNIYWSPSNWYGVFGHDTIPIYKEIDLLSVQKSMSGEYKKTHEVVSLREIDTEDENSGFIGYSRDFRP
jgi:hypothetical protein